MRSNVSDHGGHKDLDHAPDELPALWAETLTAARERLLPLGGRIIFFSRVGSTNDVASALAAAGDGEGAIVIAEEQTAGRGRRGRSWFSPPRSGLYVSVVLTPARARPDGDRATALLTLAAGVALAEAVEALTALRVDIKWPNDLVVGPRKLAGILAEGITPNVQSRVVRDTREGEGACAPTSSDKSARASASGGGPPRGVMNVVLGYGINVVRMAYPPELGDRATSLESELGRPIDRAALCAETLAALSRRYGDLLGGRFDAILDALRERAPTSRGARVTWLSPSGAQTGVTVGIDDRGALLVNIGNRLERIVAGEVTWL